MIKGVEPITSADFNKGLVTRSDILKGDINASPNTMDVQWNFDSSLHKRLGSSSTNTVSIGSTSLAGWVIDSNNTLSTSLNAYWKLDEASGTRFDQIASLNLTDLNNDIGSITGIRGQAASYIGLVSDGLLVSNNSSLQSNTSNFSISAWVYLNTFNSAIGVPIVFKQNNQAPLYSEYDIQAIDSGGLRKFLFIMYNTSGVLTSIYANSFGAINTATWYNVVAWHSNNSHIGISVNLSPNSATFLGGGSGQGAIFQLGMQSDNAISFLNGRIDEVGFWGKMLSAQERSDLYGGGSGNTFTSAGNTGFSWASFDFGASSIRWLTVAAGTGLYASSNRGATFVVIGTTRTQTYQSLNRSNNVLIATSDAYDVPLYWAGSAGTFASTVAPGSAPGVKYSINYNGFLILLNSQQRKRGFFYANQNTQLTDPWTNSFDLPSSADDEITGAFVLYKFLYVSTRYKIYRMSYVGGNPDWSYLEVKQWGYTPRTVDILTLEQAGQVAIGLDWNSRLRMFDGFYDRFISNNIENNNGLCDFATSKISYAGSGLQVCHGLLNPVTQEYRLNVAIGSQSTQTTHGIVLNARNNALYPYSNQGWQTMCIAESNNQRALMAFDRSGFCYILDSGNLDGIIPIAEVYDTPPLFSQSPEVVSKGHQLNLFFGISSSGNIYQQSRVDLSNQWGVQSPLSNAKGNTTLTGTENAIKILRTIDVKETYNTIQFRLTSSSGTLNTANPWELDRLDFLQQGFGIGKGGGG